MSIKLFVAGTDTDAGKTYISTGLLRAFHHAGLSSLGIKPVASGCFQDGTHVFNRDALLLQQASSIKLSYEKINPFAFLPPIAPHLAAQQAGIALNREKLSHGIHAALNSPAYFCLIEGAGGWHVPLNDTETLADLVMHHRWPVLLVVGMRLGCLNHAILTCKAIQQSGVTLIGWIANCIDPGMAYCQENIAALQKWLSAPLLGIVGQNELPERMMDLDMLRKIMRDDRGSKRVRLTT
ncbi:dethiobiotin synthase [Aquicella lusitana]|uniref:ATP-dependent dethiobiotin synthetase BioD n=1 Tax=Aquicella lusitana TaxID=254246 RepID=A0A370GF30_9COXI|nr:dethiobiotin synthase [Aquicella lusitana]RDI42425.1 dethiobiotin synthase [Aquicella lusitana]VVC74113.1 ATP-dependent dethiobiotin synthetase BioD 1 [Aquicella lusitana]